MDDELSDDLKAMVERMKETLPAERFLTILCYLRHMAVQMIEAETSQDMDHMHWSQLAIADAIGAALFVDWVDLNERYSRVIDDMDLDWDDGDV